MRSVLSAWVKNVNKLRTQAGTTSGVFSPVYKHETYPASQPWDNHIVVPTFVLSFGNNLFTYIFTISHLLSASYTHNPQHLLLEPQKKI